MAGSSGDGFRRVVRMIAVLVVLPCAVIAASAAAIAQPAGEPVAGPTFVVNTLPIGCHVSPDASAAILVRYRPGRVQAMDLVARTADGVWQREVDRQCWTRTAPGPVATFSTLDEAEAFAASLRFSRPYLADHRIVSFYGNPLASGLGVLGEQGPAETVARLRAQAEPYARLSDDREVVPALHLIYAVAQAAPGADGLYLYRMSEELVEQYIRLTRENGMLLFLDIQMGRSTIERELSLVAKYLEYDNVHVALDPEFAWGPGVTPVEDIGFLDASQINQAQEMLQRFVDERRLPSKILIVHQFLYRMIRDKPDIRTYDRVELVIDMDGFGNQATKLDTWNAVIYNEPLGFPAIKLFYKHDPGLMTPAEVLGLEPRPAIVIYQ